ncbi:MAG TPA: hypothetical protein VIP77_03350 [Jiangellaceae bacterium]
MLDERCVYLAAVLNLTGSASYVVATLKGRARPNKVSYFVWTLASLIAFGAELGQGVGIQSVMTLMFGLGPAMIFMASFANSQAYWRVTRFDLVCGGMSVVALGVWIGAGQGTAAIALTIIARALGAVPTVIKSYRHPRTESPWVFWLGAVSAAITILTIDTWDFAHFGFPAYVLAICGLLAALITFRIGERTKAPVTTIQTR